MALLTQSPNSLAYPALTNGIEDNKSATHLKTTSRISNGPPHVSVSKMRPSKSSTFTTNPSAKQSSNNTIKTVTDVENEMKLNDSSPPQKTSQNHPPKFKLLNRSIAVTSTPECIENGYEEEDETDVPLTKTKHSTSTASFENSSFSQEEKNDISIPTCQENREKRVNSFVNSRYSSSSGTPTKQHSSLEYSSSPSSTTSSLNRENSLDYKDSTGVDLHEFMVKTLRDNPRDRLMLLKLERDFTEFINDSTKVYYKYPPMTSYHRMLIHRVAAYFGLDHNVDATGKSVVISKTPSSRVPNIRFQVFCSREYTDEEISAVPKSILLRASSSDDIGTPPRFDSPIMETKYSLEDTLRNTRSSFAEREEYGNKSKERLFNDNSLDIHDDIGANDEQNNSESTPLQNDITLSEKESAIAAVAAVTGRKMNNRKKNLVNLPLAHNIHTQYGYGWQQNDSAVSTPDVYMNTGYHLENTYSPSQTQLSADSTYQTNQNGGATIAINAQTGQPILGPDGNPAFYASHYNNASASATPQVAYVATPNGGATLTYVSQNGQYVPVYYMNNTPQAVHQQQQQHAHVQSPQQPTAQQGQQFYMVQQTASGQLVYVPTQSGLSTNDQMSAVMSPHTGQHTGQLTSDYVSQLANMSIEHRRVSSSNDDSSGPKTEPSTPTSPVENIGMDPNKTEDIVSSNKTLYYVSNGRYLRAPLAVYPQQQQQHPQYPLQYLQSAGVRHGYATYTSVEHSGDSNQYQNVTSVPPSTNIMQQQVRLQSNPGVIQQQYIAPFFSAQQTQTYNPRLAMHQQNAINNAQKSRFVSGVLPNPSAPPNSQVYIPIASAAPHATTMLMSGQYPVNIHQIHNKGGTGEAFLKSDTVDQSILSMNARLQFQPRAHVQPNYQYCFMAQSQHRFSNATNPSYNAQTVRPMNRKYRQPRPGVANQTIRISRPNSTGNEVDQKTVSHILEIYDFPDNVTSDADAIFDEIKSSGARILKINSSSPQSLQNNVVGGIAQQQKPTILAIFKSSTEAQNALETVSSPYYKLRVSQKSPTHFSGPDPGNNIGGNPGK